MRLLRLLRRSTPPACLAVVALSLLAAPAAQAEQDCQSSNTAPGEASGRELKQATLCLLNEERGQRSLGRLHLNERLSHAARLHAADMVHRDYFSHDSLSGASFVDRIRRSGYLRSVRAWSVGENLAWGSGGRSTPESIVRAWMHSPAHKANILERRYREVGIGIVAGAPSGRWNDAATYATEFGFRG
jgi:uncharacterized protein YkwD